MLNSQGPYLVEFMGLPGSGKTTLASATEDRLLALGANLIHPAPLAYRKRSGAFRLAFQLRMHLRYRELALTCYGAAARASDRRVAIRGVSNVLVDAERVRLAVAQMEQGQLCVRDQATLQPLRSLVSFSRQAAGVVVDKAIRNIIKETGLGAGWLVIHVDTDPETASERIEKRATNSGRFDRMETSARLCAYRLEYAAQKQVLERLRVTGAAHVLAIDGNQNARSSGSAIAHWVMALV